MEIRESVTLADRTTLGVGGRARYFAEIQSEDDVPEALAWAEERRLPAFILGGGSNILVSDRGFGGLALHMGLRGQHEVGAAQIEVAAGEIWDDVVAGCVARGWAGIECLSGIPGSTGATPVQNVGAYGQEVASTIAHVRAWDRRDHRWVECTNAECDFSYRSSRFNHRDRGRFVITSVGFHLRPGGEAELRYPELQRRVAPGASLGEIREAVRAIRRGKAMLIEGSEPESHSAGSFFKNPVLTAAEVAAVATRAGAEPPRFPAAEGVKVPAAWLIEHAGFNRGYRAEDGHVGLSRRHVLALVNYGGASAGDLVRLARRIRTAVYEKLGVELTPEPAQIGFAAGEGV